ncbi:hypothetical protein A1OE_187 [Candidatus Endolissoclinum faulkneri L2]|uniref:Uncharacterized protein n=1 Tax=Candidatus Endolissoclinum faulkneri L2 TaxID=1193729 RepID=K7YP84_9PROT|nr:hypothetical protein A1OE_187 [Candidatus Endolissoclinum faulkneri L2]
MLNKKFPGLFIKQSKINKKQFILQKSSLPYKKNAHKF